MSQLNKWFRQLEEFQTASNIRRFMSEYNGGFTIEGMLSVIIFGAAGEGERLANICQATGITIVAIIDDNEALAGNVICGIKVKTSDSLEKIDKVITVIIASHRTVNVTVRLRGLGFKTVLPFMALQALAPEKFPPHMFYTGILEALIGDRRMLSEAASRVADEKSILVLDAAIGYRLTADPEVFIPVLDDLPYFPDDLYKANGPVTYIDGGAFDGDSVGWFFERWGKNVEKVFAFEPDPNTFQALVKNFKHEARLTPINKGVYSRDTTLKFKADGSRGALFDEFGDQSIHVTSIDAVLGGDRADYIKLNIEGSEVDAIWGAESTIRKYRPSMAISAYHHPCDLWRVLDLLSYMEPGYEFYLRQQDGGIIETVLYTRVDLNSIIKNQNVDDQ